MFLKISQYLQENACVGVACTRDIVGEIRKYAYKITLQDFCNIGVSITNIWKQPLKHILRNRCSDLWSDNHWKIPIMKLIFSKVAGFQQFLSLSLAGEFRAGFFLGRFFFRCCKCFTAITCHNKWMPIPLITTSTKRRNSVYCCVIHETKYIVEILCTVLLFSDEINLSLKKCFFQTSTTAIFHFFEKLFYYYECKLRNILKNTCAFMFLWWNQKQPLEVFYKKAVPKNLAIFICERLLLMKRSLLHLSNEKS